MGTQKTRWKIREIEYGGPKKYTYGGPNPDGKPTGQKGPDLPQDARLRSKSVVNTHLSRDELDKVSFAELMASGQAHAPTMATRREGELLNNPRVPIPSARSRAIPTALGRWHFTPLAVGIVVLLFVFVCVIPAMQIIAGAE